MQSSSRLGRPRSVGSTRAWTRPLAVWSQRVGLSAIRRLIRPVASTSNASGVTVPPTTLGPSPHADSIRVGWSWAVGVKRTPATSAATSCCTSTPIATGPTPTSARQRRTAATTSGTPLTPRTLRYCPAAAACSVSSFAAEERTATSPSPSLASPSPTRSVRRESGTVCRTTNPSGTGNPARRSLPRLPAFGPQVSLTASTRSTSITAPSVARSTSLSPAPGR